MHGLLARGQQVLEELFPGFTEEAIAAGVPTGDLGELRWFFNGKRLVPKSTGLICVSADRPVLEDIIRRRVLAIGNVKLLEQHAITGLVASEDNSTVLGVGRTAGRRRGVGRWRPTGSSTPPVAAPIPRSGWTELGYQRPPEDTMRIDLSYTTRHYRLRGRVDPGRRHCPSTRSRHRRHPRGAFFSRIENGRVHAVADRRARRQRAG